MMLKLFFILLIFPFGCLLYAQPSHLDIIFQDGNGNPLEYALTGGLNNPQFSTVDLDGDGIQDMVYFDRQGGVVVPFINGGTNNNVDYTFAPEYRYRFPTLQRFMLLRDYNCDGIKDLFAYNFDTNTGRVGITAHQGSRDAQNKIKFTEVKRILEFHLKNQFNRYNLLVSSIDIPAIDDIDGDGDLDIVNFNGSGGYIELFINESQENNWGCDSLLYIYEDNCWGRLYENGVTELITLSSNIDSCAGWNGWIPAKKARHSGSTILTLDMDNDGDKEVMLGDLSFTNLNLLTNTGNADTAFMTSQEVFFPQNSNFVNINIFPAAFYEDMNNDGKKDLIAAPNIEGNASNNQAWYYQNTGTANFPIFTFQQNDFLVNKMVDLGSYSAPVFADLNGDGLQDLVVGNYYEFVNNTTQKSYLHYYQNIGTATQPIFKLVDNNFANIQQYNLLKIVPTFGDIDADGDLDLIIGQQNGELILLLNTGSNSNPNFTTLFPNYASIDVGQNASPQLIDADRDGDLDLIIGERNGNINYFENTGSNSSATFSGTATTETFGWIDTKVPGQLDGSSAPQLIDIAGAYHFFVGNETGNLWHYTNVDGNLLGTFSKQNSVLDSIDVGAVSIPAIVDVNQDHYVDFIVGNKRGGLEAYTQDIFSPIQKIETKTALNFKISPNPAQTSIKIEFPHVINEEVSIQVTNILGQNIWQQKQWLNQKLDLNITALADGNYFLSIISNKKQYVQPLVIIKK